MAAAKFIIKEIFVLVVAAAQVVMGTQVVEREAHMRKAVWGYPYLYQEQQPIMRAVVVVLTMAGRTVLVG